MQGQVLSSIEEYLGSGEHRFFGAGYKRVQYIAERFEFIANRATPDVGAKANSVFSLKYPEDWSKKKNTSLVPHLSTIDAMILALFNCREALIKSGIDTDGAWVEEITIRAGKTPVEDLSSINSWFELSGKKTESEKNVYSFNGKVGTMQVTVAIAQPTKDAIKTLVPDFNHLYWDGFKSRKQSIQNISFSDNLSATSTLAISYESSTNESATSNHLSFVDAFVSHLQVGQVLLYELDDIDRKNTNTLWMRRTVIRAEKSNTPEADKTIKTHLTNVNKIQIDSREWRCVDIVGSQGGVSLICSVAHMLPVKGN
jgi:hypothetical protein